jgi:hypothetical protein
LTLDPKWNISKGKADASFSDGNIQFLGKIKSWHADDAEHYQNRWFALLDRTAFAGQRPVKPLGIAATDQRLSRSIPTLKMAQGKLRRLMYSASELQP